MLYKYNKIKSEIAQYKSVTTAQKFSFIFYLPVIGTQQLKILQSYFQNLGFTSVYINSTRSAFLINKHINFSHCLIVSTASIRKIFELPIFLDLSLNNRIFPFAYRVGLNLMTFSFFSQWSNNLSTLRVDPADVNLLGSVAQKSSVILNKFNFFKVFLSFLRIIVNKIY